MARLTSTHAAPGRPRITRRSVARGKSRILGDRHPRWSVARAKARLLGALIGIFELDRVPRPVVYDVWPDLFQPRTGERSPRSLNAAFGTKPPADACGAVCGPDVHYHQQGTAGSQTAVQGVDGAC